MTVPDAVALVGPVIVPFALPLETAAAARRTQQGHHDKALAA